MAQTTTAGVIAALDAINALIGGTGELRTYEGTAPANADAAPSGNLLSTQAMSPTAFGGSVDSSNNAVATANDIDDDTSVAQGTPGYYRIYTGPSGTCVWQGTVSISGGGGELQYDSVTWLSGGTATVSAFTIQMTRV